MQVGRTDDAVDCKSNHAVETPQPVADYLSVLMISVKLLWCVIVHMRTHKYNTCTCAHIYVHIHTHMLTDNIRVILYIYIYIYILIIPMLQKSFLHQMYNIISSLKCVCQRYHLFFLNMYSKIECRHINSDKTDHLISIGCIQHVLKKMCRPSGQDNIHRAQCSNRLSARSRSKQTLFANVKETRGLLMSSIKKVT